MGGGSSGLGSRFLRRDRDRLRRRGRGLCGFGVLVLGGGSLGLRGRDGRDQGCRLARRFVVLCMLAGRCKVLSMRAALGSSSLLLVC